MSEILRNLKAFGLTPWQLVLGAAIAYGWVNSLMPMPSAMQAMNGEVRALNKTVQDLGTKVEIHAVLISQITEIKTEMSSMRRELSTIEGRLAHSSNYRAKGGSEP
jgi:hypothetical protein